jgi:hypothetical protein
LLVMGAPDPKQAVLDELAGPAGVWEPGGTCPGAVQSGIVRGGNLEQADMSTVRLVKHRQSARRHVYFVTFEGTIPRRGPEICRFEYVYPVEPDPTGGWRVFGGAGGSGDGGWVPSLLSAGCAPLAIND